MHGSEVCHGQIVAGVLVPGENAVMRGFTMSIVLFALSCTVYAGSGSWRGEVVLETDHGMGGAAVGDLDAKSPGNEVVVVNGAGEIWLVRRLAQGWQPERIYSGGGELIMCAIGDADPRYEGNEFVGVGMVSGEESSSGAGQILVVHKEGRGWSAEPVFRDNHMLHGVAIGDVSSRHQGNEIVACGFDHRVTLLHFQDGIWEDETIYVGSDRMKIVVVVDILPEHEGLEVVACGSDGKVVVLWEGKLGWHHEVIFSDPVGQSRVAIGQRGVLIGGDKGKVTLCRRQDGEWLHEFITRDTGKIRGVAIADVDCIHSGPELYACGYSRNVAQLIQDDEGFWRLRVIFTAKRPLHHLVAGEFDPAHPGPELVTCGHGGRLIAIFPDGE